MSKPGTGAAAAAAALGAWLATPVVAILSRGSLDDRRVAAIRREGVPAAVPVSVPVAPYQQARHGDALRRARVREAQVRAAMAALPAPRTGGGLPRRSPLPD